MKRIVSIFLVLVGILSLVFGGTVNVSAAEALKPKWPLHTDRIYYITSLDYYRSSGSLHNGIDIGNNGSQGEAVYPVADGIVTGVGYESSMGYYVKIEHDIGGVKYYSRYLHFLKGSIPSNIAVGTYVSTNTKIGGLGNTGNSSGAHLHFDITNTNTGSYSFLTELRSHTFEYYIDNPTALKNVRFSSSWTNSRGAQKSRYWNWIQDNSTIVDGEYALNATPPHNHTYNDSGYCTVCGEEYPIALGEMKGTYEAINNDVPVRNRPYAPDTVVRYLKKGEKVNVVASGKNAKDNIWYRLDNGQWVYSKNLKEAAPLTTGSSAAQQMVDTAKGVLGYMASDFGYSDNWCARFVGWCARKVGVTDLVGTACSYPSDFAEYVLNHQTGVVYYFKDTYSSTYDKVGNYLRNYCSNTSRMYATERSGFMPQTGDFICFLWKNSAERYTWSHIGIVDKVSDEYVYYYEGNAGGGNYATNSVKYSSKALTDLSISCYIRPNYSGAQTIIVTPLPEEKSTLSINMTSYPSSITVGNGYGLRGSVTSNYTISKVCGYILDSAGNTVMSTVDYPNSTSMNVQYANLNDRLVFNNLSVGNYTLKVVATDSKGSKTWSSGFTVIGKQSVIVTPPPEETSTLSINMTRYPSSIDVGSSYGLRGSVTSNYTISKVCGYILDSAGNTVMSTVDYPNSTSMNVQYANLNDRLVFNNLSVGNYTLKVVATDSKGSKTWSSGFTVGGGTASNTRVGIVDYSSKPSWTSLTLRSGPGTNYEAIAEMPQGARVTVYTDKTKSGWYYVNYNGAVGYAYGAYIYLQ